MLFVRSIDSNPNRTLVLSLYLDEKTELFSIWKGYTTKAKLTHWPVDYFIKPEAAVLAWYKLNPKQGVSMQTDVLALQQQLDKLKAENEALKAKKVRALSMKVSEKGGLSVYGLGRFPVTLYKQQWIRLLDFADAIRTFITENDATLTSKD